MCQQMVSSNMFTWVRGYDGGMMFVPNHGRQQEWKLVMMMSMMFASTEPLVFSPNLELYFSARRYADLALLLCTCPS
jgi:hypothetical protein